MTARYSKKGDLLATAFNLSLNFLKVLALIWLFKLKQTLR